MNYINITYVHNGEEKTLFCTHVNKCSETYLLKSKHLNIILSNLSDKTFTDTELEELTQGEIVSIDVYLVTEDGNNFSASLTNYKTIVEIRKEYMFNPARVDLYMTFTQEL